MSRYSVPSGYSQELLPNNTIDLTNDFPAPQTGPSQHQTINPQFLNPTHPNVQTQAPQNNLLFGGPAGYQAADGRGFNYYENTFSVQPQIRPAGNAVASPAGMYFSTVNSHTFAEAGTGVSNNIGFPQPEVVIPVQKDLVVKKQSQTNKTAFKAQKKTKGRSDSGSSEESDLEIEAPDEPSPLPPNRPSEPVAAAEYDTLQAVWTPRNKWPSADKIKGALVAFKDVIKALRDVWKDQVQAMKSAENQGDNDKAAKMKQEVALQRRIMDRIVVTTLNLGHPTIVEKYASSPFTFFTAHSPPENGCHGHLSLKRIESIIYVNVWETFFHLASDVASNKAFSDVLGVIAFNRFAPEHMEITKTRSGQRL